MTIDKALETLFAMANVQDGYAKKATDPGLKVIHKANAKAQREVAATIKDLRDRLASTTADRDSALARVEKLRDALKVTGAVLMSEQNRRGGKPFSGRWSIPAIEFSGTVEDALDQTNAALDEDARHE